MASFVPVDVRITLDDGDSELFRDVWPTRGLIQRFADAFIHSFEIRDDDTLVIFKQRHQVQHEEAYEPWELHYPGDRERVAVFRPGQWRSVREA